MGRMSQSVEGPRPLQVTVAGGLVAGASAFMVVAVFDALGGLGSVDKRDAIHEAVSTGWAKSLGLSAAQATDVIRAGLYIGVVAAAAAAVLGVFVLQRDRTARIVLSVLAVPIVVTSPFSQTFLGTMIGVGTLTLWMQPGRNWFAGLAPVPLPERPTPLQRHQQLPAPPPMPPPMMPPPVMPPDLPGSPPAPPPPASPYGYGPPSPYYPPPVPRATEPVPTQLRIACILVWIFSALTAVGFLVTIGYLALNTDGFMKIARQSPNWNPSYSEHMVVAGALVAGVVFVLWCIGAAGLAVLAMRGATWAWVLLAISTVVASLASLLALPYSLGHLAAMAFCLGKLCSGPTRAWFARRTAERRMPPPV
ncbi:MAG: hypothetical protein JWP74_437 [Marmoricola sp.]|nr:hypothetical protein [Marmoricola sp.]